MEAGLAIIANAAEQQAIADYLRSYKSQHSSDTVRLLVYVCLYLYISLFVNLCLCFHFVWFALVKKDVTSAP